jgi:hypothetical protein
MIYFCACLRIFIEVFPKINYEGIRAFSSSLIYKVRFEEVRPPLAPG